MMCACVYALAIDLCIHWVSGLEKVLTTVTAEKEKFKLIMEGSQYEFKQQLEVYIMYETCTYLL